MATPMASVAILTVSMATPIVPMVIRMAVPDLRTSTVLDMGFAGLLTAFAVSALLLFLLLRFFFLLFFPSFFFFLSFFISAF